MLLWWLAATALADPAGPVAATVAASSAASLGTVIDVGGAPGVAATSPGKVDFVVRDVQLCGVEVQIRTATGTHIPRDLTTPGVPTTPSLGVVIVRMVQRRSTVGRLATITPTEFELAVEYSQGVVGVVQGETQIGIATGEAVAADRPGGQGYRWREAIAPPKLDVRPLQ